MTPILSRTACITAAAFALALHAPAQILESKLTAPDGGLGDNLGLAVASSPGWAFCTAPGDDDVKNGSGAVYVFQDSGSGWTFAQKLKATAPSTGTMMGQSVAASGQWLVAGSPWDAPFGGAFCGSAEVYHLEGGIWVPTQRLVPTSPPARSGTSKRGSATPRDRVVRARTCPTPCACSSGRDALRSPPRFVPSVVLLQVNP